MFNLTTPMTPPPTAPLSDLDRLLTLLAFYGDQKAVSARLAEVYSAVETANQIIGTGDQLKAQIASDRAAMEAEIEQERAALKADQSAFVSDCAARDKTITARAAATDQLNADAQAARDEALKITEDLKLRLARVKEAAAA
jgi:hypothetical protein